MTLRFPETHPFHVAWTQVSLPDGSFIRALPFVVDETQRFRMDALVVCADILAPAYVQLIESALRSKWQESPNDELGPRHLDIAMFQHAWSMVDQIYSMRRLLRSLGFTGGDVDAFMTATKTASHCETGWITWMGSYRTLLRPSARLAPCSEVSPISCAEL